MTDETVSVLDFRPGLKAANRMLCHTEIGQFAVVKDEKLRRWIARHQGVRISGATHKTWREAAAEASTFYLARCSAASINPHSENS